MPGQTRGPREQHRGERDPAGRPHRGRISGRDGQQQRQSAAMKYASASAAIRRTSRPMRSGIIRIGSPTELRPRALRIGPSGRAPLGRHRPSGGPPRHLGQAERHDIALARARDTVRGGECVDVAAADLPGAREVRQRRARRARLRLQPHDDFVAVALRLYRDVQRSRPRIREDQERCDNQLPQRGLGTWASPVRTSPALSIPRRFQSSPATRRHCGRLPERRRRSIVVAEPLDQPRARWPSRPGARPHLPYRRLDLRVVAAGIEKADGELGGELQRLQLAHQPMTHPRCEATQDREPDRVDLVAFLSSIPSVPSIRRTSGPPHAARRSEGSATCPARGSVRPAPAARSAIPSRRPGSAARDARERGAPMPRAARPAGEGS